MKLKPLFIRKTLGTWMALLLFIPSLSILASCTSFLKDYDLTGISFNDSSFTYDGAPHSIYLEGDLPTGVTVTYSNNDQINAGSYVVEASFQVTDKQYNPISPITANLTIEKADIEGIALVGEQFVYDGEPKSLLIEGTLPEGVTVSYTGNEQTEPGTFTVEATFASTNSNYNDLPSLFAEMTIQKATYNMEGVSFNGNSSLYDGQVHYLEIEGELPEGVDVTYYNNDQTEAGEYEVTAYFSVDEIHYNHIEAKTANLIIIKASVSGITFNGSTVAYDGNPHSLAVEGELPSGVSVVYINNGQTQPGSYTVTAHFVDDTGNYEELPDMTATLKIEKISYDASGIAFNNASYVYDGTPHSLAITGTLPEGVTVSYTENTLTDVGSIEVMASFSGDEVHHAIPDMTATLTITKADIPGISFSGETVTYDGQEHSLSIAGTLPSGIEVVYVNNGHADVGTYTVTAHFVDNTGNYSAFPDMTAILQINAAEYDTSGISFNSASYVYDGADHTLVISGTLPEGVTVSYTSNKLTNVGVLEVVACFSGNSNYTKIPDLTATLTINKSPISGISFDGMTATYDGASKALAISGTLPSGVTVRYINNEKTNAGTYTVTAKFTDSTGNYENLPDMTATLQIIKATYDMSGVSFNDTSYVFNGSAQSLTISGNLPAGVSASYVNNTLTDVGSILATASFLGDSNHNPITDKTATLTITKATISGISFSGATIDYDGSAHSLYIYGILPIGVNVTYTNNNQIAPGAYTVTAHFEDTTGNYSAPGNMTAVMQINPDYTISSPQELANISVDLTGSYVIENDIDLAGIEWTPIGDNVTPFTGALNGQGHTISSLTITTPQVYVGLFGFNSGTIKGINLVNVNINVTSQIGAEIYGGSFAGSNIGILEDLNVLNGNIYIKARSGNFGCAGGIVGYNLNSKDLTNLSNNANLFGDQVSAAGGLIGCGSNFKISNSNNTGSISVTSGEIGGLVGRGTSISINNSSNTASFNGPTGYAGGLFGQGSNLSIENSYNSGSISGTFAIGGLVGLGQYNTISRSRNSGSISGETQIGGLSGCEFYSTLLLSQNSGNIGGESQIGGIIGNGYEAVINSCANSGSINANSWGSGGLVGTGPGRITINSSINIGSVAGALHAVGGLVGDSTDVLVLNNCSSSGSVSSGDSGCGGLVGQGKDVMINSSSNSGSVAGASHAIGGLVGAISNSMYIYYSINFGNISTTIETEFIGGISGYLPVMQDSEAVFFINPVFSNSVEVTGTVFGNKVTELSTLNTDFFIMTLGWSTDIWDFTGLDVANGVYPTLTI